MEMKYYAPVSIDDVLEQFHFVHKDDSLQDDGMK